MWILGNFYKYLYRQGFHLCTDHSALPWLMSSKNPEGQMACWVQAPKNMSSLPSTVRARSTAILMVSPEDYERKSVLTVIKLRHWHQEGTAE
jgi:hypothetical protein